MSRINTTLKKDVLIATKWSFVTEFLAKIAIPLANMILARLISPEAFGTVATVTMIISIADIFTDSGFQKYLIQNSTLKDNGLLKCKNVSFSYNLLFSIILYFLITLNSENISIIIGDISLIKAIELAALTLPLTSFTSIEIAIYKKELNFREIFYIRIIDMISPVVITIPLALYGFSYWSILISTIFASIAKVFFVVYRQKEKYRLDFDFKVYKSMFLFSSWSLIESIGTWISSYIGVIILTLYMSSYYVGLYKTTITSIESILAIITAATTPVLFSYLSKIQENKSEVYVTYIKFMKNICFFIIPLGFGIFIFQDIVVDVLLGDQWSEAYILAGLWGISSSFTIVFAQYFFEIYRAFGKPKISVLSQFLYLFFLVPTYIIGAKSGFYNLVILISLVKAVQVIINMIIIKIVFKYDPLLLVKELFTIIKNSFIMCIVGLILRLVLPNCVLIVLLICCLLYLSLFLFSKKERPFLIGLGLLSGLLHSNTHKGEFL